MVEALVVWSLEHRGIAVMAAAFVGAVLNIGIHWNDIWRDT